MADWITDETPSSEWITDKTSAAAPRPSQPPMSGWDRFRQGVKTGLEGLTLGTKQLGAEIGEKMGLVSPEQVKELRDEELARRQMSQWAKTQTGDKPGFTNPASIGEGLVEYGLPLLAPAGRIASLPKAMAAGAALGGAMGGAQPLVEGESRPMRALGGATVGAVAPAVTTAAQKGVNWFLNSKSADAIIDNSLARAGIKPLAKSSSDIAKFQEQGRSAVKDIIRNKSSLVVDGEQGQLPQSVMGFSNAVDQTKDALFNEYNTLLTEAAQAGGAGAAVDTAPILKSLTNIQNDLAFSTHGGRQAMMVLNDLIDKYQNIPTLTLPQAQNFIKTLNRKLDAFYKNPTDAAVGEAYVNAEVASQLRKELDAVVSKLKGPGYQDLKRRYGALNAIEDRVAKAAVKSTGKKTAAEDMLTDKYSGVKMMYGLATGKLPAIIAGGAVKGLGFWQKGMLNPNNIVKNMFSDVEKVSSKFTTPRATRGPAVPSTRAVLPTAKVATQSESIPAESGEWLNQEYQP